MGFFAWLKTVFASNATPQSGKKRRREEDEEEEEIKELVALDII